MSILKCPDGQQWWRLAHNFMGVETGRYIDGVLASSSQRPLIEMVGFLRLPEERHG